MSGYNACGNRGYSPGLSTCITRREWSQHVSCSKTTRRNTSGTRHTGKSSSNYLQLPTTLCALPRRTPPHRSNMSLWKPTDSVLPTLLPLLYRICTNLRMNLRFTLNAHALGSANGITKTSLWAGRVLLAGPFAGHNKAEGRRQVVSGTSKYFAGS